MSRDVLVTSVGSGVGYGIVESLRRAGADYRIVGVNCVDFNAGSFRCDTAYSVPPIQEQRAYRERLMQLIDRERPAMVYAGHDTELALLAGLAPEARERFGCIIMVCSPQAAELAVDKYALAREMSGQTDLFVRTVLPGEELEALLADVGFPVVVKPRRGYASRAVHVVFDRNSLEAALAVVEEPIVQPYLVPDAWHKTAASLRREDVYDASRVRQEEEYVIQLVLGHGGDLLGSFVSCNSLSFGVPIQVRSLGSDELLELARQLATLVAPYGMIGPCNFSARRVAPGDYRFFEMNARFTGLSPTRAAMGFNECEAVYDYFVEGRCPRADLVFDRRQCAVRYVTQHVLPSTELETLEQQGQWHASS